MKRFLLYYLSTSSWAYVLHEQALRDVRSGAAILDKTVLESDFAVRSITRPEERAFYVGAAQEASVQG